MPVERSMFTAAFGAGQGLVGQTAASWPNLQNVLHTLLAAQRRVMGLYMVRNHRR